MLLTEVGRWTMSECDCGVVVPEGTVLTFYPPEDGDYWLGVQNGGARPSRERIRFSDSGFFLVPRPGEDRAQVLPAESSWDYERETNHVDVFQRVPSSELTVERGDSGSILIGDAQRRSYTLVPAP